MKTKNSDFIQNIPNPNYSIVFENSIVFVDSKILFKVKNEIDQINSHQNEDISVNNTCCKSSTCIGTSWANFLFAIKRFSSGFLFSSFNLLARPETLGFWSTEKEKENLIFTRLLKELVVKSRDLTKRNDPIPFKMWSTTASISKFTKNTKMMHQLMLVI